MTRDPTTNLRLGAVSGLLEHSRGVLGALKLGRTVTITSETLAVVARDPARLVDLHHHLTALEAYVREVANALIAARPEDER